ncbi:hypothetical protein [Gordonia amicalis]|nr:hypothetical protein [Gordonia amicalis]
MTGEIDGAIANRAAVIDYAASTNIAIRRFEQLRHAGLTYT